MGEWREGRREVTEGGREGRGNGAGSGRREGAKRREGKGDVGRERRERRW